MSHFAVTVIGENIEEQLAPYHEFECTGNDDQYVQDIDVTEETKENGLDYYGLEEVSEGQEPDLSATHKYGYAIVDKEGNVKRAIRRTNPNKKWDWWTVGGRWNGHLKLKDGDRVDVALKEDIDFDGMAAEAEQEASTEYDMLEAATNGIEPPVKWEEFRERFKSTDEARKEWNAHPWIKAFKGAQVGHMFFGCPVKHFRVGNGGRQAYVDHAKKSALATFAAIKDGKWYERGSMGWWGMVSGQKDPDKWSEEFAHLLMELPENTMITVVDCHI